ncbi:hemolysin family protein [Cellulomonas chengniuliangii]|uniref:hemolysin family protein n=1 Tax=Cellulomonas chengniuliangii TaxID=2968084 RepID=UPI001D0DDFD5|nr:hemolysin family protein [Cellulomonas chengniuliangii]MCC2317665.1 hemolysin family protein [Cellulomonas chengniuliangii]
MDSGTVLNVALVLVFVLVGGVFAGTEFALVSLRDSQISQLAQRGARGARVAGVARDPNRFLAAVQIGVTVAGFLSAAYGASTLAPDFAPALERLGLPSALADTSALVLLTLVIAYLSLVLGELAPKRIALQRSAQVALLVGPPLDRFASAMRPVIWLLSRSTDLVVRALGGNPAARSEAMTEEELRDLVVAHEALPEDERQILTDVFSASRRSVVEAMRPRGEVVFLTADLALPEAATTVRAHPYSRYPVTGEDFDDVIGFLHVRDLLEVWDADDADGGPRTVREVTRDVLQLPGSSQLLPALAVMRRTGVHLAIVVDEYGGTDGIITLEDLVEELVGDIRDEYDPALEPLARGDFDAGLTIEAFADESGIRLQDGPYETVAGYVLARLGRLARQGDVVDVDGRRLTVAAVEDRRIRRVTVTPVPRPVDGGAPAEPG